MSESQRPDSSLGAARGAVAFFGGALAGILVFGPAGYGLGLLFLSWFGPESCCGLEGLLAPAVGLGVGGGAGLLSGGTVAWRASERGGGLRPGLLLSAVAVGLGLAWGVGETLFTYDYEDGGSLLLWHGLSLGLPLIGWAFWPGGGD